MSSEEASKKAIPVIGLLLVVGVFMLLSVTGVVMMTSQGKNIHAAGICGYTFSPTTVSVGGTLTINITADASSDNYYATINPIPSASAVSATRIGPGSVTLKIPNVTPGTYQVYVQDSTAGIVCTSVSGGASTNLTITAKTDSDYDGFSDAVEQYIGTDPNKACGVNAWPPDIDNDGTVTSLDLSKIASAFTSKAGDAKYNRRYDLDADGTISVLDLALASKYFGKQCSSIPISLNAPTVTGTTVKFTWSPAITSGSNVEVMVFTNTGNYQSGPLQPGATSWTLNNLNLINYSAQLMTLNSSGQPINSASNPVTFNVTGYQLPAPTVTCNTAASSGVVNFTWSPAITSGSNVEVMVFTNTGNYQSGPLQPGATSWTLNNLNLINYSAQLMTLNSSGQPINSASNPVQFAVSCPQP